MLLRLLLTRLTSRNTADYPLPAPWAGPGLSGVLLDGFHFFLPKGCCAALIVIGVGDNGKGTERRDSRFWGDSVCV